MVKEEIKEKAKKTNQIKREGTLNKEKPGKE
jgi:hypothetical protein